MVGFKHQLIKRNALTRNSICGLEYRELSVGARQRKGNIELTFEHLSEILIRRVDADGIHRYMERI